MWAIFGQHFDKFACRGGPSQHDAIQRLEQKGGDEKHYPDGEEGEGASGAEETERRV